MTGGQSAAVDSPSRIKWGYDPRDDYKMRNEMDLLDLNWEQTKPATFIQARVLRSAFSTSVGNAGPLFCLSVFGPRHAVRIAACRFSRE